MGPKKGRPRKIVAVENSDKPKDITIVPKAPRGRPAKKKPVLATTPPATSDFFMPSIENVTVERKSTRGRGRRKARLSRDVFCASKDDGLLTSETISNSDNVGFYVDEVNTNSEFKSSTVDANPNQEIPEEMERANFNKLSLTFNNEEVCSGDDRADKENSSTNLAANISKNPAVPDESVSTIKFDSRPVNDQVSSDFNPSAPTQEEAPVPSLPFSPGDVPLKKRRLRDLVTRDMEVPPFLSSFAPTASQVHVEKHKKLIGAHVLYTGGYEQAIYKAKSCGYQAFGMFVKDLQTWVEQKAISKEDIDLFQTAFEDCSINSSCIVSRGSYIINICSTDAAIFRASIECVVDDVNRCISLGLLHYTIQLDEFNPPDTKETCIERVAKGLNSIHKRTTGVITVLENTCGKVNTLGGSTEELKKIFDKVEDKSRIGFALDTCHLFSCGLDLRKKEVYETLMQEFDETIGLSYLKAVYLNDSGGDLGSHEDHHVSINQGKIGLEFFETLINDNRLHNTPLILETPILKHIQDLRILNNLIH